MNRKEFDEIVKRNAVWSGGDLVVNWDAIYEEINALYRALAS